MANQQAISLSNKILTIIVPAYNMEKYLERCLSSLLIEDSLMKEFEVLIINDGSKDKTSEIAHKFEASYPDTFRSIDKENGHYGSCINRGIAEATGTFIKILDADDAFDKIVFSSFLKFIKEDDIHTKADVILSDFSEVTPSGETRKIQHYSKHNRLFSIENISDLEKYEWFIHGLSYKTDLLRRIHYHQTEGMAYTDHEWSFIPMTHAKIMARFEANDPLYLYTVGRLGQTIDDSVHAKNLWMEIEVIEHLIDYFQTTKDSIEDSSQSFLFDRLYITITHIYQLYLVTYKYLDLPADRLFLFDNRLKVLSPALYSKTENYVTRIGGLFFQPIKNWRHHRRFAMYLQSSLYFIADHIARLKM